MKLGGMERGRKKKGFKMSKWEKNKFEVLKDREVKQAASCVSHISQLSDYFTNPSGQIKDQYVRNNISKFQLNPTVDEVAMTIFVKEVRAELPLPLKR